MTAPILDSDASGHQNGVTVTVGTRHWDHVMPVALGDVRIAGLDLRLSRRDLTPGLDEPDLDVAETSFSGYVHRIVTGDTSVTALPVFIMQGFRHRCVITRSDSPYTALEQLSGSTIGLTGWPDSGNIWTRALLRRSGVDLGSIQWRVGPLTTDHPVTDRIGPRGAPANVQHTDAGGTLVGQLLDGRLDAVMTPFMPPGFHRSDSGLRPLLPDVRTAEREYFEEVGYVPGMHVLVARSALIEAHPLVAQQIVDLFEAAKRLSITRHTKLQDVLPWMEQEMQFTETVFGADWMPYGLVASQQMITDFVAEQQAQLLLTHAPTIEQLFRLPIEPRIPDMLESGTR